MMSALQQQGAGYLVNQEFLMKYTSTVNYIFTQDCMQRWGISTAQIVRDITWFHGAISATMKQPEKATLHEAGSDGVLAWIALESEVGHAGDSFSTEEYYVNLEKQMPVPFCRNTMNIREYNENFILNGLKLQEYNPTKWDRDELLRQYRHAAVKRLGSGLNTPWKQVCHDQTNSWSTVIRRILEEVGDDYQSSTSRNLDS